jgi:antitoxin component YwqK of YwqJK toxin-antitoxin module
LVAVAAALAALLFLPHRSPKPAAVGTVARDLLTLRDGRLCQRGAAAPFSGVMTELYAGGALKSRSCISNGLLEGLSEGWHTNGQKQVEEHFRAGVSHGWRTKWHANRQKLSEVMVVEGQLDGLFRRWHEDGSLAEEIWLKKGKPDGLSLAYYPSGFLKAEARLRGGQVLERKYWNDGQRLHLTLTGDGS